MSQIIDPLELSLKLISCPSVTPMDAGAQELLYKTLSELGFNCHKLKFSEDGYDDVNNLYARLGCEMPNLCFAGHTDVVPPGDEKLWKYPPFEPTIVEENGKKILYGRGSVDMKTAICAFVSAVSMYLQEHTKPKGSISFMITGDEEAIGINGTKKILKWCEQNNEKFTICLLGEMTSLKSVADQVHIGRRGSMHFYLTVNGKQGHVAYPKEIDNPNQKLVSILKLINDYVFANDSDKFEMTNCEILDITTDNKAENVSPSIAKAHMNIRFGDAYTPYSLEKIINALCMKITQDYELKTFCSGSAFIVEDKKLQSLVGDAVFNTLKLQPKFSTSGGTSDARFIHSYCPTIECGLLEKTAHQVNEHTAVDDIYKLRDVYYEVIKNFFVRYSKNAI